ncbi:hypothetical protein NQZ79_g582 [Umbelopsis isabellina]|nr:hypothetical protein NQZ79_g582 [Umbelopsis isabellina]
MILLNVFVPDSKFDLVFPERKPSGIKTTGFPVLWTPRALEILDSVGIASYILEKGQQHHKFYTYNGGQSTGSFALWANETSKFQSCVALPMEKVKDRMVQILNSKYKVFVEYEKELVDLDDEITAIVVHDGATEQVQCQYLIGADGVHSYIRQRLGIPMESRRNDTFFYTLIAQAFTNFPGSKSVSFIDSRPGSAMVIGHDDKINFTFEHHPSWSQCNVDQQVPLEVAIRHLKSLIEPYQLEIHKVVSYEGWQTDIRMSEELQVMKRVFLIGAAAQGTRQLELFGMVSALEHVNNLCWKIRLDYIQGSKSEVLETFNFEMQHHIRTFDQCSLTFQQLLAGRGQHIMGGLNSTMHKEIQYHIRRHKAIFSGLNGLPENRLNLRISDKTFAFVTDFKVAGGDKLPDGRLKPYRASQILELHNIKRNAATPTPVADDPSMSSKKHTSWSQRMFSQNLRRTMSVRSKVSIATTSPVTDTWKQIKGNYFYLLDRIGVDGFGTFTVLVFLASTIQQQDEKSLTMLRAFNEEMNSPRSFTRRLSESHQISPKPPVRSQRHSAPSLTNLSPMVSLVYITNMGRNEIISLQSTISSLVSPDHLYLDHNNECHTKLGVQDSPAIFVVRPDGYVGASLKLEDHLELATYFDSVGA